MKAEHKGSPEGFQRVFHTRKHSELARLTYARQQRRPLADISDAIRLLDGSGDGFPGLFVDQYADCWVVSTFNTVFPEWVLQAPGWQTCFWRKLSVAQKIPPQLMADHSGRFTGGNCSETELMVREHSFRYFVRPGASYSSGLFLDQRGNRMELLRRITAQAVQTKTVQNVLNTFSYTCSFSVVAASAGALTTSVDLSSAALQRGRANFLLNNLDPSRAEFFKGDVFEWLPQFVKKKRRFNFIILDPPTFSRDANGRIFKVARDYQKLLALALDLSTEGGTILACTNMASITNSEFRAMINKALASKRMSATLHPGKVPSDFTAPPLLKSFWIEL